MKQRRSIAALLLLFCLLMSIPAAAAQKNTWQLKNSQYYYYGDNDKPVTGLFTIKNRTYYFDKQGRQHIGWQKIGRSYYFFQREYGAKGYMKQKCKINKIRINSKGKAVLNSYAKEKLPLLIRANKVIENITKPAWSKEQKLKAAWNYSMRLKGGGSAKFDSTGNWELKYAKTAFSFQPGQCYAFGAAFAFLAYSCGYDDCYVVSTGMHGWARVGNLAYDPANQQWDGKRNNYYGRPQSLWNVPGTTKYFAENFKRKI